jgi:hypothetical protein
MSGLSTPGVPVMVRKLIGAALLSVVLTETAEAQLPLLGAPHSPPRENALQQAESERQMRAALTSVPDKKPSNDPWHNMRSAVPDQAIERHRPQ